MPAKARASTKAFQAARPAQRLDSQPGTAQVLKPATTDLPTRAYTLRRTAPHATATGAVLSCRRHSVRALCPMPRCRTSRTKGAGGVVCWPRGKRSEYTGPAGSSAMTRVLVVLLRRSCDCDSRVSNLSGKHRLLS